MPTLVSTTPRIQPVEAAAGSDLDALLQKMTPPGAPHVLALFRVLAQHPELAERMTSLGGFFLGRRSALSLRDREIVIDRVCARCGAAYEWGVHVTAFRSEAGLDDAHVAALAGQADLDAFPARDQLLIRFADALHDTSQVPDALWDALARHWSAPQLLELLMLAGWYHAIAYVCNGARVPLEAWGAPLART